jgi:hypothetical protein
MTAALRAARVSAAPASQLPARSSGRARLALGVLLTGYVAFDLLAGARSSPLVPPMPVGAAVPGWIASTAKGLGLGGLGWTAGALIALGVLAVLVAAFGLLVAEAWSGRVRLATVLACAAAALAISAAGPLVLSRDVYSYAAYGRILSVHHANPYLHPPSAFPSDPFVRVTSAEWLGTRALYGPVFVLAGAAITRAFPSSPQSVILTFKLLAAVGALTATGLAAAACHRLWPGRAPLAVAAIGLNPVVVVHTVGGAHSDALSCALLAGALVLAVSPGRSHPQVLERPLGMRALGVTVLLTLVALVKLILAVPGLVWLWFLARGVRAGRRTFIALVHAGLAAAVSAVLFAPLYGGIRTFAPLATLSSVQGWASGVRLVARAAEAVVQRAAGSPAATGSVRVVAAAFLALFAVVAWRRLRSLSPDALPDAWGTSLLLFALTAPYLTPWYSVWFLPFVALLGDGALVWIGLATTSVLALTGVPAEPGPAPAEWRAMLLGVHYAAAPIVLGLFAAAVWRVIRERSGRWPPPGRRRRERTPGAPPGPATPAPSG